MKLRPLQDRVIVKQSEAEEKTASGILLPDTAKEKPTRGKVIAVGPGKLDDKGKPMELGVRVNDTVILPPWGVYLTALSSTFVSACASSSRSPKTSIPRASSRVTSSMPCSSAAA